jgi:predicted acyl esterase
MADASPPVANVEVRGPAERDARAEEVMVAMRDGVRLATDVYLPPRPEPLPAILVRLPYDKGGRYTFMPALADPILERGYAFIVQDVRGKFRSEGATVPYLHEVEDGYDTLEWVVEQPWSDGVVGMFGDSYYGWTQWAAVASRHPALRAIVPRVTSADLGSIRVGTTFDRGIVPLYGAGYFAHHWVANPDYEFEPDWSIRPLAAVFDGVFSAIGQRSAAFDMMVRRAPFQPFRAGHPFDGGDIPALHCVGWFDNIGPDSMRDYMTLRARGWTGQYLHANSTDHENYPLRNVPISARDDHDRNDEALARLLGEYLDPALAFFDVFLKGRGSAASVPTVRYHVGREDWHSCDTWPPPSAQPQRLYLAGAGEATSGVEGGILTPALPTSRGQSRITHDPTNPVPSTVANPFAFLYEYPDERPAQSRPDVATYTAAPQERDLVLAGPVTVRAVVSATSSPTHVYAKLSVVAANGAARMIARGQTFVPDARGERLASVYLGHTAYRLGAGERLRLHLAASDFPLYLHLFGGGQDPWAATQAFSNELAIQSGGTVPSFLEIVVKPAVSLP